MHESVINLLVDVNEAVSQAGEVLEAPRKLGFEDTVLLEHGERVAEIAWGTPPLRGDDVVRDINARLRRGLSEVAACQGLGGHVLTTLKAGEILELRPILLKRS